MKLSIQSRHLSNYTLRAEQHQGKDYLVVPVVMLVEGVHCPANGVPTLYLAEEFSKIIDSWNGIPVTVNHPKDENGEFVQANSPDIIDHKTVGIIYNTTIIDGKLKAEAWIEKDKTNSLYPSLFKMILNGKPLEVSTGVYFDRENNHGQLGNDKYEVIGHNYVPNHLALLPGDEGACNWDDGCGIRANEGGELMKKWDVNEKTLKAMKVLSIAGFAVNELGFRETSDKIQSKLDGMDTDVKFHSLQEVFEDEFVFSVFSQTEENLFKRSYTINADETIEFTGEPVAVTRKTEFVEITANKGKEVNAMSKKKESCCPAKVKLLVMSGRFDETDDWLNCLEEPALDKLLSDKDKLQVNRAEAIKVLKEDLSSPQKLVDLLSGDAKAIVEHGLALNEKEREELISHITANAAAEGGYTAEELRGKSTDELKKMSVMVNKPGEFSALNSGSPVSNNAAGDEMLLPVSHQTTQKTQ